MNAKKYFISLSSITILSSMLMFDMNSVSASKYEHNYDKVQYVSDNVSKLDNIFLEIYNTSKTLNVEKIKSDEEAYAILLQNRENTFLNTAGLLEINYNDIYSDKNFTENDKNTLKNFVERVNTLVTNQAITINENLQLSFVQDITTTNEVKPMAAAPIVEIMHTTRNNKNKLKSVFDNAVFSTRHLTAGLYFAERVKSGGEWDFKVQLGTTTSYYFDDLKTTMTGEAIGNFHYGYVGRAVFGETTLKSSAGMYQIISGTSSFKYYDSFFDDPKDQQQIQAGLNKYN